MNAIVRFLVIAAIIMAFGTLINQLIPSTFSSQINNAIVSALVAMLPMNFLIPMDAVYNSIQIIGTFVYGILLFIIVKWVAHFFTQ